MILISAFPNYLLTQSLILIGSGVFSGVLWLAIFRKDRDALFGKNPRE
jgi:hypothetical protein